MRNLIRKNLFKKNPFRKVKKSAMAAIMAAITSAALANPSGPNVRHGEVNIQGLGSGNLSVEQMTQQAIINWNSFSIGASEAVQFLQPNQMAVILNRVTGGDPSQILGQLRANGNVFLINPNGILFGPNSTVDVGGLVASTLNITDQNFLSGNYTFEQDPNFDLASIVNQGTITVSDGGYAVLTAPLVSNEGLIVANLGKVVLAGGEKTTLNFDGRNLISYELGSITGDAGTVVLPRESVSAVLTDMLGVQDRATGLVQRDDGSYALEGASGTVYQAGTIRADGAPGQDAGTIVMDSARLTVLGEDSLAAADGVGQGSGGGSVYALSDLGKDGPGGLAVGLEGSVLSAQGGETGDGGFIEFSGERFNLKTTLDASAIGGTAGTFLLDPRDIFVVDGNGNSTDGNDDQTIGDDFLEGIAGSFSVITLLADRDIIFQIDDNDATDADTLDLRGLVDPAGPIDQDTGNNSNTSDGRDIDDERAHLVLNAGRHVDIGDSNIIVDAIDILAGTGNVTTGTGVIRANDIDIGVDAADGQSPNLDANPEDGLGRDGAATAYASNITAAGINLANRVADPVGGFVDINIDLFAPIAGAPSANLSEPNANVVTQDLTILAEGDITVTSSGTFDTRDQIRTERYNNERDVMQRNGNNLPGIATNSGDILIDVGDRFFASGKGRNDAVGSGDSGRNGVLGVAAGSTVEVRAGTIQDRAGGIAQPDIAANAGNIVLTASQSNIGILANGGVGETAAPFDIGGSAITALTPTEGALISLDLEGYTVSGTIQGGLTTATAGNLIFVDIEVNDGLAYVREDRAGAPSQLVFDPATTAIRTEGAFDVNSARFANRGNIQLGQTIGGTTFDVNVDANSTLILEAIADGADAGSITENVAGITLGNDSFIGLIASDTIGTSGDRIEITSSNNLGNAGTLAADAGTGIFVDVAGDLIVGDTELVNTVPNPDDQVEFVSGLNAGTDIKITATGGDADLRIRNDIVAVDDIDIVAVDDIIIDDDLFGTPGDSVDDGVANITGGGNVVLVTGDAITQEQGGLITAARLGLEGDDIGTATNSIDTATTFLAMDAGTSGYVQDVNQVRIINQVAGQMAANNVVGNDAGADYRVQAGGSIRVEDVITGTDITLLTTSGVIRLDTNVGDANTVNTVLSATGNINQTAGVVQSDNLGLDGSNIGTATDSFDIDADNLAVDSEGNTYIEDRDVVDTTVDGVNIVSSVTATVADPGLNTPAGVGDRVLGNDAVGDYRVQAAGTITVDDVVTGGDISLIATAGGVTVNQNVGDAGTVDAVMSATTNITGNGVVAADNVGLDATNIGAAANSFDIDADNLAVDSEGNAYIEDRDTVNTTVDGVNIVNSVTATVADPGLNTPAGVGDRVLGNDAMGDYRVQAAGTITVDDVVTGGDVSLIATAGGVTVNQNVGDTGTVDAVLSASGNITGNGVVAADSVGLEGTNIGAATNSFDIDAATLTVDSAGSSYVQDTDTLNAAGVVIVNSVTATAAVDSVTGNDAAGDYRVQAGGLLEVDDAITAGTANDGEIALVTTDGNVQLDASVGGAQTDSIVLTADDDITQSAGTIQANELGLEATNIGLSTDSLDTNVDDLTIDSEGSAYVQDADGVRIVNSVTATAANDSVTGNDAAVDYRVQAGGLLEVDDAITAGTANDGEIALVTTDGNVQLDASVGGAQASDVVIIADDDLVQNAGTVIATEVGLESLNGDIGISGGNDDDNAVAINATSLALNAANGNANVRDIAGGVNLINEVDATVVDDTVTGTTIGGDLELEANGTDAVLTITDAVTIGDDADLVADGNVVLTGSITGAGAVAPDTNNIVVRADNDNDNAGSITGVGQITADGLGLAAAGDIGDGAGGALIVDVDTFAVDGGGNVHVEDQNGTFTIDSVTAVDETVNGANAGIDLKLVASGTDLILNANATAGGDIDIVADQNVQLNADVISNAANGVVVIAADADGVGGVGSITQLDGEFITGTTVGLSAQGDIGAAGAGDIDIRADQLAIETAAGSAFADDDTGNLAIINFVDGDCFDVTGNTALNDYRVESAGTITVQDDITVTDATAGDGTGDIALVAGNGITVETGNTVGGALAEEVVLSAAGDITGDGRVEGNSVGLDGNNIGASNNSFDIDANDLTIDSEGSAYVQDTDGVRIVNSVTATAANDSVTGNDAAGDYRVQADGLLEVDDAITAGTANDGEIALVTTDGNVQLDASVGGAQTDSIVLTADDDITQSAGTIQANELGLEATNIGLSTDSLDTNVDDLTIDSEGSAYVQDADGVRIVNSVTATAANDSVTGNDAAVDYRVQAGGLLEVDDAITAGTANDGEIALVTTDGNVQLDASVGGAQASDVVIIADDDLVQNAGTVIATEVGLESLNGDIGISGGNDDDNAVAINATSLALNAANGNANVRDIAGGVNLINEVDATVVDDTVTGTTIGGTLELEADGGNTAFLTIDDAITAGGNIDLVADDNITLNQNINAAGNNVVVRADDDDNENGAITGVGAITATGLGLAAGENIGTPGGAPLDVNVVNLAVNTDSDNDNLGGSVNVRDNDNDLNIVATLTGVDETVSGANSAGTMEIEAAAGDLNINGAVTADNDIDLVALNDVNLNANVNTDDAVNGSVVVRADSDDNGTGAITQVQGNVLTALSVGLSAGENSGSAANPIDINATNLAVEAAGADLFVNDTAGGVTIIDEGTGVVETVTGNTATNLAVNATGGDLTVNAPNNGITATEDLDLTADGAVNLDNGDITAVNAVLSAGTDITQTNGTIDVTALGLETANGQVGTAANPFDFDATDLSVDARDGINEGAAVDVNDGNAYLNDTAGGVNIVEQVTGVVESVSDGVNGVEADNDLAVTTQGGTLNVDTDVTVGEDLELVAGGGDLNLGRNGTPVDIAVGGVDRDAGLDGDRDNAVLKADGNITQEDGGTLQIDADLGLETVDGDVGSLANPVGFDSVGLSLDVNDDNADGTGGSAFLIDTTGGVEIVDEVTAVNEAVSQVGVANNVDNDLALESQDGDLSVAADLTTGEDLEFISNADIDLNDALINVGGQDRDAGFDGDGDNSVLSAGGDITQDAGGQLTVDNDLGLETVDGNVGTQANPLDFDSVNVTVDVRDPNQDGDGGSAYINDTAGGVNLIDEVTAITESVSDGVVGVEADNDLALTTQGGTLNVDTDVTTGEDLELVAGGGDLNLGRNGTPVDIAVGGQDRDAGFDGDNDNAVLKADGNITQEDGGTLQIDADLGLETVDGDVGSPANPIEFDSVGLSLDVNDDNIDGTGGSAYLVDTTGGVEIVDQVTAVNEAVSAPNVANNVDNDLALESEDGDLSVAADLTTGEDLELVSNANIDLNDSFINVGGQDRDAGFDGDGDNSVLSAGGDITQDAGGQLTVDNDLGLETVDGDVGTQANPLDFDSVNLTVDVRDPNLDGDGGNAYLNDTAGGVDLIDEVTAIDESVSDGVNGVEVDNDLGLTTQGGDLNVDTDVTTGEDLELIAGGGDLNLGRNGTPVDIAVGGADLDPGFDGDNDNAVLGADGDITQEDGGTLQVDRALGLFTTDGDVGTENNPLDFDAIDVSVDVRDPNQDGDGGSAYINDVAGGINIIDTVTAINVPVSDGVNGVEADNDLLVTSQDGDLNVNVDVTTGEDLELVARDGDNSGDDGDVNLGQPGTPVDINVGGQDRDNGFDGDGDNAIVIADGDINQEDGGEFNVDNSLGLQTVDGDIGTPADPLEFDAVNLAVDIGDDNNDEIGGNAFLDDVAGGVTIVNNVNSIVESVNGNNVDNDLSVESSEGDLNVEGDITTGEDLELIARDEDGSGGDGNLNFGPNTNVDVGGTDRDAGNDGDNDNAIFSADNNITTDPGANISIDGGLGVQAGGNAGESGNPLSFDAQELVFDVGQDAFLEDTAGGVTIVDQVDAINLSVVGNQTGQDAQVVVQDGDLTIDDDVMVGDDGEFVTEGSGDIIINECIDAVDNVVVVSAGDILNPNGTGKIAATQLGIAAPNGTIGTQQNPINVEVDEAAVGSEPNFIDDPDGFNRVDEVTAIVRTVRDLDAPPPPEPEPPVEPEPPTLPNIPNLPADPARLIQELDDPFINIILPQDNVGLVEDILTDIAEDENRDNSDNIYNEKDWQPLDDEDFGLRKRR